MNYEVKECELLLYWLVSILIICNCIKGLFLCEEINYIEGYL